MSAGPELGPPVMDMKDMPGPMSWGNPPENGKLRTDYKRKGLVQDVIAPAAAFMTEETLAKFGDTWSNRAIVYHALIQYRRQIDAGAALRMQTENGLLFISREGWRFE